LRLASALTQEVEVYGGGQVLTWLADALRAEGCRVAEVGGWKQRQRPAGGELRPVGIINHHTAGRDDLNLVLKGRPPSDPKPLPGPLANLYLAKDGTVHVVAAGTANHAGSGAQEVLDRAKRDQPPRGDAGALGLKDNEGIGSSSWVGIEVENLGNGKDPYPDVQIQALVLANAAICRHQGWTAARCVHHREWTKRKIDMSHRGPLRDQIAARLGGAAPAPGVLSMADVNDILAKLELLRVGDKRDPTKADPHDFASLEGVASKVDDARGDITWLKAAVKAIAQKTGATLPPGG
jgi:hypothetical protein